MPQIPVPGFLLFTCHCQAGSCTESLQLLPYFPIATVVALAEVPASPLLPHHSSASSPPLSTPVHTPLGNLLKHTAPHVTPGPAAAPPPLPAGVQALLGVTKAPHGLTPSYHVSFISTSLAQEAAAPASRAAPGPRAGPPLSRGPHTAAPLCDSADIPLDLPGQSRRPPPATRSLLCPPQYFLPDSVGAHTPSG